jgi:hypothetical protein
MDCSTFAFDLHVLGTPPALILSQDQTLMLNSLATSALTYVGRTTQLTRGRFIGSCVVQSVLIESGSSPVAFARTEDSGRPIHAMPPADSHCPSLPSTRFARDRAALRPEKIDGLCVLARLSSFQRTDGSAPVAPYPTSHRATDCRVPPPRCAWKAVPPVGRGSV